jgi:Glycosyl hydrolases family 2, TIM barrel domain
MILFRRVLIGLAAFVGFLTSGYSHRASAAEAVGASHVELRQTSGHWQLFCDGHPFFVQGAGGDASRELLKRCGGNSFRLWGADNIDGQLDEANRLGLKVAVGIWLEHTGGPKHFSYHNPAQVAAQFQLARQAILKFKDNPAVLLWGIGNEMEGENGDDPAVWHAVQDIARLAHQLDPNHPTMTVTAEIGAERVPSINKYCPDIDIHGINSYAGIPTVASRYRALGGTRPFIITEFGPPGAWEDVGRTPWRAPIELTSTAKADVYRAAYTGTILAERGNLCLGSYCFLWGHKEEATATWFGMFLPDGSRLGSVDAMQELWTGRPPAVPCPKILSLKVDQNQIRPGSTIHAALDTADPSGRPLTVKWVLTVDPARYITGGAFSASARVLDNAISNGNLQGADIEMPAETGPYWLYAYVHDDAGGAATAVVPLDVNDPSAVSAGRPVTLPLKVYGADASAPYAWSGWMGDNASLALDLHCADNPHSGAECMKLQFKSPTGFGGIVAQDPPNDWGDQPGGLNLTGATKLTFWARGETGGEAVSFKMGILGSDKKYPDSDHAELPDVSLTSDWKQYSIDLSGKNLARIKTGFVWVVAANGKPITFYLSDIQYE